MMLALRREGSALLHAFLLLGGYPLEINMQWTEQMFEEACARQFQKWLQPALRTQLCHAQGFQRFAVVFARASVHLVDLRRRARPSTENSLMRFEQGNVLWERLTQKRFEAAARSSGSPSSPPELSRI